MLSGHENSLSPRVVKAGSLDNDVSYEEFAKDYVMLDNLPVLKADYFESLSTTQEEFDALPGEWKDCPPFERSRHE